MTQLNSHRVRRYMEAWAHIHRDSRTGEYNATHMAEDAAKHFNCYDDAGRADEILFDIAADLAAELYALEE